MAGNKKIVKATTGAAGMVARGRKQVQLWLDASDYAILKELADDRRMPVATMIRHLALRAGADELAEQGKLSDAARLAASCRTRRV